MSDEPAGEATPPDVLEAPLRVSLVRKSKPFEVEHENGTVHQYKLVELDGASRDKWITDQNRKVKFVEGKSAGMATLEGVQAELLAMCVVDHTNARLSVQAIQKWPATTQNTLFKIAQKMNGLDKEAMEDAKKA